jgi:hypothetical protein
MKAQKPSKMTKLDGVRTHPFVICKERFYYHNCEFRTRPLVKLLSGWYSNHFKLQVGGSILNRSLYVHPKAYDVAFQISPPSEPERRYLGTNLHMSIFSCC